MEHAMGLQEDVVDTRAGLYLTFVLSSEIYGFEILKVQEIIGQMPVTHVPNVPKHFRGVINLRGKVIPVVDLGNRFGLGSIEENEKTCIIVLQIHAEGKNHVLGVMVDEVSEVLTITEDQIEDAPNFGSIDMAFIMGMGKVDTKVVMLLDGEKLFSIHDIEVAETHDSKGENNV